ncbi:hypothetical protein JCM33374_g4331 [Metschnikowia sp. JCM 33374]|nr:hypothetical protein JCM33374_g4331 [Metschnikowia sp. JCM 33374]
MTFANAHIDNTRVFRTEFERCATFLVMYKTYLTEIGEMSEVEKIELIIQTMESPRIQKVDGESPRNETEPAPTFEEWYKKKNTEAAFPENGPPNPDKSPAVNVTNTLTVVPHEQTVKSRNAGPMNITYILQSRGCRLLGIWGKLMMFRKLPFVNATSTNKQEAAAMMRWAISQQNLPEECARQCVPVMKTLLPSWEPGWNFGICLFIWVYCIGKVAIVYGGKLIQRAKQPEEEHNKSQEEHNIEEHDIEEQTTREDEDNRPTKEECQGNIKKIFTEMNMREKNIRLELENKLRPLGKHALIDYLEGLERQKLDGDSMSETDALMRLMHHLHVDVQLRLAADANCRAYRLLPLKSKLLKEARREFMSKVRANRLQAYKKRDQCLKVGFKGQASDGAETATGGDTGKVSKMWICDVIDVAVSIYGVITSSYALFERNQYPWRHF